MLPIDRTAKATLDANLVNGILSDAPKLRASENIVYDTIDELYNFTANLVAGGVLQPYPAFSYRQALINSNLDVWQRGTSFTNPANGTYVADRWLVQQAAVGSVTRQSFTAGQTAVPNNPTYYLNLTTTSVLAFTRLTQKIEDVRSFAGQKITVSFWAKSAVSSPLSAISMEQNFGSGGSAAVAISVTPNITALTTSWQLITGTVTLPSISGKTIGTSSYLELQIFGSGSVTVTCNIDIAQVQVCAGAVALPFQPKIFAVELALCQRYYEKSYDVGTNPGSNTTVGAFSFSQGVARGAGGTYFGEFSTPFKFPKRATPTVNISATNGAVNALTDASTGLTVTGSVASIGASQNSFILNSLTAISSAVSAGDQILYQWTADAEL